MKHLPVIAALFLTLIAANVSAQDRDYIVLTPADKAAAVRRASAAAVVADGATVTYTAFDKTVYSMRQFNGKYTALLIKQSDLDMLTIARAREMIDRNDVLYTQYVEFLGWEPPGPTLLLIAYVKNCGAGCGAVGMKGIEVDPSLLSDVTYYSYPILIHEMQHNFDLYSSYIFKGPDMPHSWADFMHRYMSVYNRYGGTPTDTANFSPETQLQYFVDQYFTAYLRYPGATWQKCIEDVLCDDATHVGFAQHSQGGVVLRIAQVYGVPAMKNWVRKMAGLVASRKLDSSKMTDLQKVDFLVETLSLGVGSNVSCFFDSLKWPVSDSLRAALQAQFGDNAFCKDADGDGYTPYQGDCNDANASIHPGATEVLNGLDNNCNGVAADVLTKESGDFPDSQLTPFAVSLPARIQGTISSPTDSDAFSMQLASPAMVSFTITSTDVFKGFLFLRKQGSSDYLDYLYVGAGGTASRIFSLASGKWVFDVDYNASSNPGAYELDASVSTWPIAWNIATPISNQAGRYTLVAPALPAAIASAANPIAKFWISGAGWVGSAPASKSAASTFTWVAPDSDLGTNVFYRVMYYDGDLPALAVSDPISLPITTAGMSTAAALNGASFQSGAVAPGQIISIFGTGIGPASGVDARLNSAGLVDNNVAATRVLFDGVAAPLFYVRADQVNAVVPYAVNGASTTNLQMEYNGAVTKALTLNVAASAPGIFTTGGGTGQGAILNSDMSPNSASNPAPAGSIVVLFATGEGATTPAGVDGKLSAAPYPQPVLPVSVTIGGLDAPVIFKAQAPGFSGLFQVNAQVPTGVTSGKPAAVLLKVGSGSSQVGVTLAVK